eukprot:PLAT9721.2.p1 GENE.PLAT9721.2~~PLAT9721.2.p1  ORF type:complete len:269 (+),score=130.37 PLAT9721.2:117-809(+)
MAATADAVADEMMDALGEAAASLPPDMIAALLASGELTEDAAAELLAMGGGAGESKSAEEHKERPVEDSKADSGASDAAAGGSKAGAPAGEAAVHPEGVEAAGDGEFAMLEAEIASFSLSGSLMGTNWAAQVLCMKGSYFVWVGGDDGSARLQDMVVAVASRFSPAPMLSPLLGGESEFGGRLASTLTLLTGCEVFASVNLAAPSPELEAVVLKGVVAAFDERGLRKKRK